MMDTLIGILVMVLAVLAGVLIGVLIASLSFGRAQKKQFKKLPPAEMLKEGYFDEARVWVNPARNSMIAEIDGEYHRDFKSLTRDQKRRVNYVQQLFGKWSEEEEAPVVDTSVQEPATGWVYEKDSSLNPPGVLAELEKSLDDKESLPVVLASGAAVAGLVAQAEPGEAGAETALEEAVDTSASSVPEDLAETQVVEFEPEIASDEEPVSEEILEAVIPVSASEENLKAETDLDMVPETIEESSPEAGGEGVPEPESESGEEAAEEVLPKETDKPETGLQERELSVTEQVNEVMQRLIVGSGLEDENISLVDDHADGVIVKIGEQEFHDVESVPYPQVRELIRLSVQQWKDDNTPTW